MLYLIQEFSNKKSPKCPLRIISAFHHHASPVNIQFCRLHRLFCLWFCTESHRLHRMSASIGEKLKSYVIPKSGGSIPSAKRSLKHLQCLTDTMCYNNFTFIPFVLKEKYACKITIGSDF